MGRTPLDTLISIWYNEEGATITVPVTQNQKSIQGVPGTVGFRISL